MIFVFNICRYLPVISCHEAIQELRIKGEDISDEEAEGVLAAILLHDIGHGPFSHVMEDVIDRKSVV